MPHTHLYEQLMHYNDLRKPLVENNVRKNHVLKVWLWVLTWKEIYMKSALLLWLKQRLEV